MFKQVSLLIAVATFFQVCSAHAGGPSFEKEIQDQSESGRRLKVEFKANTENPELGRAWLFAYYDQTTLSDTDGPLPSSMDIMVPGLSYSSSTKQIIYKKSDGSSVVCADKLDGGVFSKAGFRETGRCHIELSKTTISQDSGFYIKKSPGIQISLSIQE